jgi:hypothetical protein
LGLEQVIQRRYNRPARSPKKMNDGFVKSFAGKARKS